MEWEIIGQYKWVRVLTFIAALLLAWELSTCDFNYYLNTAQYFDRFLLIIFAFLILLNPGFVLPFLVISLLFRSQFNYPVGGFALWDKRLLFDLLVLLYSYIILRAYLTDFNVNLLFLLICIVMSNYFASGLSKLTHSPHGYEWLAYSKAEYLFMNVHQCGWLQSLSPGTIESMKNFLQKYGIIIRALVLATELSAILVLWRKGAALVILSACFIMHIGIFIFGSMLFWKWMVIDATIVFILLTLSEEEKKILFTPRNFILSMFLVIISFVWLQPLTVIWFDTPFNQFFSYEVSDEKGNIYNLDRSSMNPYNQFFQYGDFLYLVDKDLLSVTSFGYTHKYMLANRIIEGRATGILEAEEKFGANRYDSAKAKEFDEFIQTYFLNKNRRNGTFPITILRPPEHIYNSEKYPVYSGTERVKKFSVIFNQTYFDGQQVVYLYKKTVREIPIP